ncbi:NeuD/PglB/VioB family sugar acetyltransferase [Agriterribacter humi]|uniref:NeuD/PglB/VioB family sugar acetyltransferase n=1 Tax=Agriterribacter humi TaxID=1104781 RepID=UPI0012641A8C|nr:NeuD/PglB/VioB family sugar acetyltransferase [Agriterribacter humi]
MKRLAIIGSGDLGQQIAHHALTDKHYQPVGFFDDFQKPGVLRHGYPVLGDVEDIVRLYKENAFDVLMTGIGYKHFETRVAVFERFSFLIPFGSVIHSSSYIDSSCHIGQGVFIYPGCSIDMNATIGNNVLINAGCIIAHDSHIGDHSFLSPGVNIAGFVTTGKAVGLGIGTIVIDNITIGPGVRTGAGAVVTENISAPGLYLGVPAKFRKLL